MTNLYEINSRYDGKNLCKVFERFPGLVFMFWQAVGEVIDKVVETPAQHHRVVTAEKTI